MERGKNVRLQDRGAGLPKKKHMSGALRKVMVIFAVLFVLMGITISQAFMLPGFLLALLYFVYDIFSQRDYEYTMENGQLTIDVIYGKNTGKQHMCWTLRRWKWPHLTITKKWQNTKRIPVQRNWKIRLYLLWGWCAILYHDHPGRRAENKTSSGSDRGDVTYDENTVSGKGLFCIIC